MGKDKNADKDALNSLETAEVKDNKPKTITEPRQCQTCEASGLDPADNSQLCPDCGGSGTVE